MSTIRWPQGSGEPVEVCGKVSRFEELIWELQQEHLLVVRQLQDEVLAAAPRQVGPRRAGREGSVSLADRPDIDAFSRMPPISEVAPPIPLPPEGQCLDDDPLTSSASTLDFEPDPGNSGSMPGAIERRPGGAEVPEYGRRSFKSDSARTTGTAVSTDSNRGVRHVRRMLDRWSVSASQTTMLVNSPPEEAKSSGLASFLWSKARGFLEPTEERNLFEPSSTQSEDASCCDMVRNVVTSPTFELIFAALIFVNTLVLAVEAQYDGMQSGYDNGLGRRGAPSSSAWPGAERAFGILEVGFGIVITLEVVVKIFAIRCAFVTDLWNVVDVVIVVFWLLENVFRAVLPLLDPKIVRMARLARLLRFLRIVKTIQAFDSLYLIVSSIKSSMSALAWSSVVLLLGEMMLALLLNRLLEDYWSDDANLMEDREEIYGYFGTFTRALQTMIEMLLGNWYSITRLLTSKVSEWYMLFGITHQLVVGFAVVEVITGVFLHETFKVANLDDGILLNETKREIKDQTEKMMRFFKHADEDDDGELDRKEFRKVLKKDKVQEWMTAQGLDVHNIEKVFALFDQDKNGMVSAEELVAGTLNLKGQAKAMELAIVRAMVEDIHCALQLKLPKIPSTPLAASVGDASHGSLEPCPVKVLPGSIVEEPR